MNGTVKKKSVRLVIAMAACVIANCIVVQAAETSSNVIEVGAEVGAEVVTAEVVTAEVVTAEVVTAEVVDEVSTVVKELAITTKLSTLTDGSTNTVGLTVSEADNYVAMGNFKITSYCGCRICNGKWAGHNGAYGLPLTINRTVAVDPRVIPLGTWLEINIPGKGWQRFRAEDTGGSVKGKHIDVYIGQEHGKCYSKDYNTNGAYAFEVRLVR